VVLGLQTSKELMARAGPLLDLIDNICLGISLIPGAGGLSVLPVVSIASSLCQVVEGFITVRSGIISVFALMALIFYIIGGMATKLFSDTFPQWFGTLGESLYSLFQIMTQESWSMGIVRPIAEVHPYAWAFFVLLIMVATFSVVNLVVGLIVTSMDGENEAEDKKATDDYCDDVMVRPDALAAKVDALGAGK